MAANFVRSTRKLKPWMIEQVDSGKYPGLTWIDPDHTCFRIPWKHGGKQDFRHHEDAAIFKVLLCGETTRSLIVKEASNSRKRKVKEETKDVSSEDEVKPKRTSILVCMEAEAEVESVPTVSSSLYLEDSGIGSASSSPQGGSGSPQNVPDSPQRSPDSQLEITLNLVATEAADTTLVLEEGINAMRVTIFYGAHRMLQKDILSGDCKISSAQPALVASQMERIYLPPATTIQDPVRQQPTQELLTFLKKGLMLASTPQGIFAQRFCQGRVFWTGPCSPQSGMSNKLEKGACVKIFDTNRFLNDLDLYQSCQGPKPKYQVEQMLALQQLTQEVSEAFSNSITLVSNPESEELLFPSTDEHVLLSLA
ncbi:interferon regulatory factor 9-like isoform X2 [Lissotriton helveticus]